MTQPANDLTELKTNYEKLNGSNGQCNKLYISARQQK
jgi:hypothetical protein